MKTLSYYEFIKVVDLLNSFFDTDCWQIGNYGELLLSDVFKDAPNEVVIPDVQAVLCVWYDDSDDLSAFPEPWFDDGKRRMYLL